MDELAFRYFPQKTFLHKTDIRFKLISMILLSLTCSYADVYGLFFIFSLSVTVAVSIKLPVITYLKSLKFFYIFLFFIILSRGFFASSPPFIKVYSISLSILGLKSGLIFSLRLIDIIFLSFIFISTSKVFEIISGLNGFFFFIPSKLKNIGLMTGLMIRFLPLIIAESEKIKYARSVRCVEKRGFSLFRIKSFIISLMLKIFYTAENVSAAMDARAFSENRKTDLPKPSFSDWIFLFISALIVSIEFLL